MADLFDLVAKLTLDSSEYSSGLDSALGKAKSIGGTIAKVGTAAVGAAAAGIVAFGKSAVEAAANYETSFAQLQTIMDSTAVSTDEMSAGLMEMSSRMGVSASELAETTYNAISATGDTAGALSIVENATKLATAGFTDTASSLSVLTTAMNSYKMSAEETAGISDSLIAVQNLGVTTVAELSSSMGKAIASASAYSVDLYNLESAYVSMTKSGINTAESTTYISSMMKELGSESTTVAKVLKSKTGKSFAQLMQGGKSLGDVLGVLNEAVDGDATALMNLWGSAEAGKASNAILSQGLEQFNDNLVAIRDSAGMTEKAYEKMTNTLQHKTGVLKTNFENLKIAVGSGMIPGVGEFIDLITNSVGGITEAVKEGDWDKALETVGDTISEGLSMAVSKTPKVVEGALALLENLGKGLVDNADQIFSAAGEIVDLFVGYLTDEQNIKGLTDGAVSLVTKFATFVGQNASKILPAAASVVTQLATELTSGENLQKLFKSGGDLIDGVVDGVLGAVDKIADQAPVILDNLAQGLIDNLPSFAGKIAGNLVKIIKGALFSDGANGLLDWVNIFAQLGTGNVGGAALLLAQRFQFSGKEAGNAFVQSFNETLHGGIGAGGSTTHDGVGGGGGTFGKLETEATQTANVIATTFSNLNIDLSTEDAVANLDALKNSINGIIELQKSLATADEQLAQVADGTADEARLEKQLTRAKETVDAYVANAGAAAAEMASAITSSQEQVDAFLANTQTTADGLAAQLQGLSEQMTTVTTSFTETAAGLQLAFQDAATSAVAAWDSVPGEFSRIWGEIASAMNISEASSWGADMVSNFISGVDSKMGALRAKVQEMANLVKSNIGFSEPSDGPLSDFHTYAPDMMDLFMQGITENEGRLRSTVQNAFDFRDAMTAPDTMTYTSTGSQSSLDAKLDSVVAKLDDVIDAFRNQRWEMDGDVVAEAMDRRLGASVAMKMRV